MGKLIEAKNLKKYFETGLGNLHAVDDVSFSISKGKCLGVVGESGCGKSTLGRVLIQLLEPTAGQAFYKGENMFNYSKQEMKEMRRRIQIIFQDPYASLNPRMATFQLIEEPLTAFKNDYNKEYRSKRVHELMDIVGLSKRFVNAYPHELDGGRRQRIGIARALALEPEFIVCDEPVSALDVSIQAQILNLMMDLQDDLGIAYMFITHDLSVVRHISSDILVMYLGQCIERAPTEDLFKNPRHPYTKALLDSILLPNPRKVMLGRNVISGEVKSPIEPPPGCRFADRCPEVLDVCRSRNISETKINEEHYVSCVLYE